MIRKKWKSVLLVAVMAGAMGMSAPSMAYAQEYVEGEVVEVSAEDNQELGDFSETSSNQEESDSVADDPQSLDAIGGESQVATEGAQVQSETDLPLPDQFQTVLVHPLLQLDFHLL